MGKMKALYQEQTEIASGKNSKRRVVSRKRLGSNLGTSNKSASTKSTKRK